ncbi:MAG: hypothetical protein M3016_06770 [Actinomycetota bacterium]|nr:hypothetical protein [Actinomycetota bacterium]
MTKAPVAAPTVRSATPVASVVKRVAPVLARVTKPVAPVLARATKPVAPILARVTKPVAPILARVTKPVAPVLARVTKPAAPVLARVTNPTAPLLARTVKPVAPILAGVLNPAAPTVKSSVPVRAAARATNVSRIIVPTSHAVDQAQAPLADPLRGISPAPAVHVPVASAQTTPGSVPGVSGAPSAGTTAGAGSSGMFFFACALLAALALGVPRLAGRLRLVAELGRSTPFVLLLADPG